MKYLRKHSTMNIVPLEMQENLSDEEDLERNYIRSEDKRTLHRALHSLKPEYRQVLYLTSLEGFSNSEAAFIMKKTDRQIKSLIYNAKKTLKTELERSGFKYEN